VKPKAILVAGASSGIGASCALRLARAGHRVVGVSRSGTVPVAERLSARVLDIRDQPAVERTMQEVVDDLGRLDAVINAAGIAVAGPLEDTPIELIRAQLETTLLGTVHLIRTAAPYLRRFAPTRFIQIASIAGHVALPYQSLYCASHFGLIGLCDSLRHELEPQGIHLVAVEPGSVRTPITTNRRTTISADAYRNAAQTALAVNDQDEQNGVDPERVAETVERVLMAQSPPDRCSVGHWQERMALPARAILPGRWFRRIMQAHYHI
jgi:NAD(P)-dependent dehydrogenase (short-subunit alcohol dehydrogenase family)